MSDLTPKMLDALKAIRTKRAAFVTTETNLDDTEAFVHWITAEALERRGLVRIDFCDIFITDAGLDALTEERITMSDHLATAILLGLFHHHGIDVSWDQAEKYIKAIEDALTEENKT